MFPCTTGVVQFKLLNIEKGSHKYKQGQDSATGFIRTALAIRVAVPTGAIPIILKADNHCVSEDDATAKAMRYWHDAILVDVTKYPCRAGEAGSGQFCYNCQLYKKVIQESYTRMKYANHSIGVALIIATLKHRIRLI